MIGDAFILMTKGLICMLDATADRTSFPARYRPQNSRRHHAEQYANWCGITRPSLFRIFRAIGHGRTLQVGAL